MKRQWSVFLSVAFTTLAGIQVFGGSAEIIKQRAKDLRDQNNAAQGVTTPARAPAPPSPSPQPAQSTPAKPLTPQQQAMARLQASLSAIRPGAQITPELKDQLTRSLIAVSPATPKPSSQAAMRLSEDLAAALSQKLLSNVTRNRLAQNLGAILNPASVQASQAADTAKDIQAIFESNGVPATDAKKAAGSAQAIADELRKTATK
jgi:hypothetical protein